MDEAHKKKRKRRESPRTPPGSLHSQPPPPAGASGAPGTSGASGSSQLPPPPHPPSTEPETCSLLQGHLEFTLPNSDKQMLSTANVKYRPKRKMIDRQEKIQINVAHYSYQNTVGRVSHSNMHSEQSYKKVHAMALILKTADPRVSRMKKKIQDSTHLLDYTLESDYSSKHVLHKHKELLYDVVYVTYSHYTLS
ncbi:hypothetical protein Tco_0180176 [Tanacetum coccineum]